MVNKLTVKQEKFAQKYIELGNASEAYRQSYNAENSSDETIHINACNLLKHTKVSLRVKELQAKHLEKHSVTVESLVKELEEARVMAIIEKQNSAAVSATMGKAKIHGFLTDNIHHSGNVTLDKVLSDLDGDSTGLPED